MSHVSICSVQHVNGTRNPEMTVDTYECRSQVSGRERYVTHTPIQLVTLMGVGSKAISVCMQHSNHLLTSQTTANALCTRILCCCVTLWDL